MTNKGISLANDAVRVESSAGSFIIQLVPSFYFGGSSLDIETI